VLVLTSSGTGFMEASVSNLTSPGDKVLALTAGKFAERWVSVAKAFGCFVESVTAPGPPASGNVAPVDRPTALDMVASIRTAALLDGVRGEKPSDISALANLIVNLSQLPFLYPDIEEADLNPVFLYEEGLYVADARVVVSQPR